MSKPVGSIESSTVMYVEKSVYDALAAENERLCAANAELVEAIRSSIARSDDYGDSHCSQPIRQALKKYDRDLRQLNKK